MEDILTFVISALVGVVSWVIAKHFQPKHRTVTEMTKWYQEVIDDLKKHNRRLQGFVNRMRQGIIPSDIAEQTDVGGMVDAIIASLPANYRAIASNFAPVIKAELEKNPQLGETIKNAIMSRLKAQGTTKEGDVPNEQASML